MRRIIGVLVFMNCFLLFAQQPVASIELVEHNILYRGYANKVIVGVTNNNDAEVVLSGKGCVISKSEEGDYYIVKPSTTERVATINVLLVKGTQQDTVTTKRYRVMNLPDPTIYLGTAKSGYKGDIHERKIFVKYPPEIPLNSSFEVRNWEIVVNDRIISGKGNTLTNVDELFQSIKSPTKMRIVLTFIGPDQILRKLEGEWELPAWSPKENKLIIESGG